MKTDFYIFPMVVCFIGVVLVIGMTFLLYSDFSNSSASAETSISLEKENEPIYIIEAIKQLKEMDLLDLIDLKREIGIEFENLKTDFEIDVSGILDIFPK